MPKSQVASRAAQDAPITVNQATLRQARLDQRYRQISQADNASTTGLLVNPPAAVIANPTGAGGQAGGQGQFGSGTPTLAPSAMGAGTNDPRGYRGRPNPNRTPQDPLGELVGIYTNPETYTRNPFAPTPIGTSRRDKGGNVNPMLARNVFAGVQTGAGAVAGANVPNFIPSGTYLPNVPVNLSFGQTPQQPRAIINQPGFNGASVPVMPMVAGQPQPAIYPQRPAPQAPQGFQTPTTNGFSASPSYPATSYMAPQPQNNTGTAGYWANYNQQQGQQAVSNRPTEPYSEANAQQWKDYWNWAAANPEASRAQITADAIAKGNPDPFAPVVMTREQIWEMKAAQRRRQMAKGNIEPASYGYSDFTQNPIPYTGSGSTGNYYSTILNTGSG